MPYTVFSTEIPYPLMWGEGGWLPLRLEGKDYEIAFERVWRPGIKNMEMKYDRLGRMSYTKIAVRFPYATAGDNVEELRRIAHKAINRLLDVYRVATKESYIGHVPIHELGIADTSHGVYTIKDDGSIWERHSVGFDLGPGITHSRMQEIDHHAIWDLAYERPLSVVDILILNARRSVLFEDYRIAVIEAETAFEVGVDRVLARYYLSKTTQSAEGYVVPACSKEGVSKILDAGLINLLKDHLPKVMGKEFIGTDEHGRWSQDLYTLRNAVVHDGRGVQSDEAERALEAAEDALVWMGELSPQQWPTDDGLNHSQAEHSGS